MEQENNKTEQENRTFDLANENDRKELDLELESQNKFFRPVSGTTYKVELTNTKVSEVLKVFDDREVIKYELQVKTENADKEIFEGVWEVGKGILAPIFKGYEEGAVFKITKTGTGLDTRYSVVKDF